MTFDLIVELVLELVGQDVRVYPFDVRSRAAEDAVPGASGYRRDGPRNAPGRRQERDAVVRDVVVVLIDVAQRRWWCGSPSLTLIDGATPQRFSSTWSRSGDVISLAHDHHARGDFVVDLAVGVDRGAHARAGVSGDRAFDKGCGPTAAW